MLLYFVGAKGYGLDSGYALIMDMPLIAVCMAMYTHL